MRWMVAEPVMVITSQYMLSQTIMLYALNLHSGVYQLFLNKTWKKNGESIKDQREKMNQE